MGIRKSLFVLHYSFNDFLNLLDVVNIIFFDIIVNVRIELEYNMQQDNGSIEWWLFCRQ